MKTKVNEIPLVGPKGRRELLNKVNELEKKVLELEQDASSSDSESEPAELTTDDILNVLTPDDILDAVAQKEYLTFEAVGDSTPVYFVAETYEDDEEDEYEVDRTIEVSTDCINWTTKTSSEDETLLATLNTGEKLYIRGTNTSFAITEWATDEIKAAYFKTNKDVYVYGNIMSLLVGDKILSNYYYYVSPEDCTFAKLFYGVGEYLHFRNDKRLALPLNMIRKYCYYKMFAGCTKITFAPKLPSIGVGDYGYCCMFEGCTSLKDAPELPAKSLGNGAYKEMFKGCTNLENAPKELPSNTVINNSSYYGMFEGCTKLTKAPKILSKRFGNNTASRMFYGCSKLSSVECHVTNKYPTSTENWLYGVSPYYGTLYVPQDSEEIWESNSPSGVPSAWSIKTLE